MEWLVFQQGRCLQDFGNVVKVEDLIKECISRTKKILDEKNELTEEEKNIVAKKVGIGALIFSNLSTTLIKDSVFVWENVLDFTGDTAPYIQYVNVRINSILKNVEELYNDNICKLKEDIEKNLESVFENIDKEKFEKYVLDTLDKESAILLVLKNAFISKIPYYIIYLKRFMNLKKY